MQSKRIILVQRVILFQLVNMSFEINVLVSGVGDGFSVVVQLNELKYVFRMQFLDHHQIDSFAKLSHVQKEVTHGSNQIDLVCFEFEHVNVFRGKVSPSQ